MSSQVICSDVTTALHCVHEKTIALDNVR